MFLAFGCRQIAEPDSGDLEEQEILRLGRDEIADMLRANRFHVVAHAAIAARALIEWNGEKV
jgi:hypothetical protein